MPPFLLAVAGVATLILVHRALKRAAEREMARQQVRGAKTQNAQSRPVDTLVWDTERGVYRPVRRDP